MKWTDRARGRSVFYFAHPLGGDLAGNVARAERWLSFLMEREPEVTFLAPWIPFVRVFLARYGSTADDSGHPFRARCLLDNIRIAMLELDGIVLTGGRVSPGMELEKETVFDFGGKVCDLSSLGDEPPVRMPAFDLIAYGIECANARAVPA